MMTEVPIIIKEETQYLDVCAGCYFIWFDPQEFEHLPKLEPAEPEGAALPLEARQALARARLEILKQGQELQQMGQASPDNWWQLILGFFGMPRLNWQLAKQWSRSVGNWESARAHTISGKSSTAGCSWTRSNASRNWRKKTVG
jgi:hypothetical protein